jgi:hypothetical protein
MPVRKEIMHPIFLECCQFTDDDFWKNIFEDLAYGTTPYGTYISKGFLCCSYKGREFSLKIKETSAKKTFKKIQSLLINRLGVLSKKEKRARCQNFQTIETTIKESRETWKGIKKKNVRNLLIEMFVIDMKHQHSLSVEQSKRLLSIILVAIMFKVILSNNIKYDGSKIVKIEGLHFKDNEFNLESSILKLGITYVPDTAPAKKKLIFLWEKYLKEIESVNIGFAPTAKLISQSEDFTD